MKAEPASAPGRLTHTAVRGITGIRLLPLGASALLVNISSTGLLAESVARVSIGSPITVGFDGGFTPKTADGRVVRCEGAVMGQDGRLRYHIAIEFDAPLALNDAPEPAPSFPSTAVRNRW